MKTQAIALPLLGSLAFTALLACTETELPNHGYLAPVEGVFNPNAGGSSPGAASASASTPPPPTPAGGGGSTAASSLAKSVASLPPPLPECEDALKLCDHIFSYPVGTETSVEVRGTFASDGWVHGIAMSKHETEWTASLPVSWNAEVQYKFVIHGADGAVSWITDPQNSLALPDGQGGMNSIIAGTTCTTYTCAPPLLGGFDWRDAVLYFVFVDRFLDGNPANNRIPIDGVPLATNYQGGDYAGVVQKINEGYFNDLGVNVLWLTVPMQNPDVAAPGSDGRLYSAYHGYWPEDVTSTEDRFGTQDELRALVATAHEKNIKVILDYAMHHVYETSSVYVDHPEWFWPETLDNGQSCVCGSPSCGWDGDTGKRCWFASYLPSFNFGNADARKFSIDNAVTWVKRTGADGFRLDAVKQIDDAWITDIRARVQQDIEPGRQQHFYMVGETFTGDQGLIKRYVDPMRKLDGQFDFPLRLELLRTMLIRSTPMTDLDAFLATNDEMYGSGIMSTFIGNHDVPRAIHFAEDRAVWGDPWSDGKDRNWTNQPQQVAGTMAYERLANVYALLLTTKGIPLIYYGDEVGMAGAGDPDNRRMMKWSGYNAGQLLLKDRIQKLTAIRAAHPALRRGARTALGATNETLAYKMTWGADAVWVVINRGDTAQSVSGLPAGPLQDELGGVAVVGPSVLVGPRSALVLTTRG